jgi:replicative DNA helicase
VFPSTDNTIESLKTPPFSREAEQSVLGGLEDFHLREHQILFDAIKSLSEENKPCDLVTLGDWLQKQKLLDGIGGGAYLGQLAKNIPSAENIIAYAEIVRDRSILRQLVHVGTQITENAFNTQGRKTAELLDDAERLVFEIAEKGKRSKTGFIKIGDILNQTLERIDMLSQQEGITGRSTGFNDFDDLTSGLQQSDLIIVAGRPSMGKCIASDCQIVLADGSIATIKEIYQRKKAQLFTLGQDYQFYLTQPTDFIDDGFKPVFRITTQLGRCIETTLTHPFLTPIEKGRWQPLSEISVGEKIAVPRKIGVFGTNSLKKCQIIEAVEQIDTDNAARIPPIIFKLQATQIALFLNRLFATAAEGWTFVDHNAQIQLGICSASEELIRQIQHLLLRFGIVASINISRKVWQLKLLDANSIQIFINKIGKAAIDLRFLKKIGFLSSAEVFHYPPKNFRRRSTFKNDNNIDIYWDKITAIEPIGLKQVYDLTIPETHNFVANDVCVHNTSFAMNLAENVAVIKRLPVAVFSMEMSDEQLAMRLISSLGRVNLQNVRTGKLDDDQWTKITEAVSQLGEAPLFIDDTAALNPTELRSRARRLARENGQLGLIVIDYLQLMQIPNSKENRTNEVSEIARALKSLAKELNVPVVALSQLNRSLEQRSNKRPIMSDLRESGEIEQSADLIVFIYRDEVYNEDSPEKGKAEIIIAKQRNGPIGMVLLSFNGPLTRFESYTPNEPSFYGE